MKTESKFIDIQYLFIQITDAFYLEVLAEHIYMQFISLQGFMVTVVHNQNFVLLIINIAVPLLIKSSAECSMIGQFD